MIALCFSCKSKISAQESSKVAPDFSADREKFSPMVYSNNQVAKGGPAVSNFVWSTQSDFISASGGCYKVQVRVYLTYQGQKTLVASDDVNIGDSCPIARNSGTTNDSSCEGVLPDGNVVIKDNGDAIYCLYELLIVNIDIYNSYKKTIAKY